MLENTRHLEQSVICWVRTPQVVFGLLSGHGYKPQIFFCLSLSQFNHLVSSFNLFPKGSHCLCFLYESDLIFGSHYSCSAGKQSLYTLLNLASYHNLAFFLKFCFYFFFLVITFKFYSFSKCQLCSVVLSTIVTSFTLDPQILFILQQKIRLWISHSLAWYWDTGLCPCFALVLTKSDTWQRALDC